MPFPSFDSLRSLFGKSKDPFDAFSEHLLKNPPPSGMTSAVELAEAEGDEALMAAGYTPPEPVAPRTGPRPSASLGHDPDEALTAFRDRFAPGSRGAGSAATGRGRSALIGSAEEVEVQAAQAAEAEEYGLVRTLFGGWGEAAEAVLENIKTGASQVAEFTGLSGAVEDVGDAVKSAFSAGDTVAEAAARTRATTEAIKGAGGAKAYFEGGAGAGLDAPAMPGTEVSPMPSGGGFLGQEVRTEVQMQYTTLVENLHDMPEFDGFDYSSLADAEDEIETLERMQQMLKGGETPYGTPGDFPGETSFETPGVTPGETQLTMWETPGADLPGGEDFSLIAKRGDAGLGGAEGSNWVQRVKTSFKSSETGAMEARAFHDFAGKVADPEYTRQSVLVFHDIEDNIQFPELPTMNEQLKMRGQLDPDFFDDWMSSRAALVDDELTEQSVGLGQKELYREVAKDVDKAMVRSGAAQATMSRTVQKATSSLTSGTNPRALGQTLVADVLGDADWNSGAEMAFMGARRQLETVAKMDPGTFTPEGVDEITGGGMVAQEVTAVDPAPGWSGRVLDPFEDPPGAGEPSYSSEPSASELTEEEPSFSTSADSDELSLSASSAREDAWAPYGRGATYGDLPDLGKIPDTFSQESLVGSAAPVPVTCTGEEDH